MPTGFVALNGIAPLSLFDDADLAAQRAFFARRPELAATPLHSLRELARRVGLGAVWVKDETSRFGLNAFKSAGALFAVATLQARGTIRRGDTIVCASEGNHGRAVARAAREAGCAARVYMSVSVAPARVRAIESEAAHVVAVNGTYDDAVRIMARDAEAHGWTVVSDTSWEGYSEIPRLIMLGYTRILDEVAKDLGDAPPDAIFVPAGVGGLLAAAASWNHLTYGARRAAVVAVEPASAACVQASLRAGQPAAVAGPFETTMGGLRCGEMSPSVFPTVASLVDAAVGIEDDFAFRAMRRLAQPTPPDAAVACGPSGAAAMGGLLALLSDPSLAAVRARARLAPTARIVVLATEGVTDPDVFATVMARP
jgi:diaminopropionate ammonia-lyase